MKISALEEYGLRCLLQLGRAQDKHSLTINEIAEAEGITVAHARKLLMVLREADLVESVRGRSGGYVLKGNPTEISVGRVLELLGGRMYDADFCGRHAGQVSICVNSGACSVRSLWGILDGLFGGVLHRIRLADLIDGEAQATVALHRHLKDTVEELLARNTRPPERFELRSDIESVN
ncbi:MAG TPA: Rrf2 family transcriptional regulator [candidate division Zixibacteria bacterium]|jgi:Rrf2 family protein